MPSKEWVYKIGKAEAARRDKEILLRSRPLIVIDEVSMVRADLMDDLVIHPRVREFAGVARSKEAFA